MMDMPLSRNGVMRITPLWLRFFVLTLLAVPAFTPVLNSVSIIEHIPAGVPPAIAKASVFLAYALVLFAIIVVTIGIAGLTRLLAVAIPLALVVSITRALLPEIPFIGAFLQGSKPIQGVDVASFDQLVTMLTVIPLALFVVQCFPASEFILRMRKNRDSVSENTVRAAILFRVYVVVTDAIASFRKAWTEENPRVLLPRYRSEATSTQKILKFPFWFFGAAKLWSLALITYSIEQIPPLIHQLDVTLSTQLGDTNDN